MQNKSSEQWRCFEGHLAYRRKNKMSETEAAHVFDVFVIFVRTHPHSQVPRMPSNYTSEFNLEFVLNLWFGEKNHSSSFHQSIIMTISLPSIRMQCRRTVSDPIARENGTIQWRRRVYFQLNK